MLFEIPDRDKAGTWLRDHEAAALALLVLMAAIARLGALLVLHEPVAGDAASYMEMARTIIAPGPMTDSYGNLAFYSPGYPMALSAWFRLTGAAIGAALLFNLVLGVLTTLLVHRVTRVATGSAPAALLAAAGYAVLVPAVAGAALLQRETLSAPLLLLFALAVIALPHARRPRLIAAAAGLAYGAGVLAGASVILTALAAAAALLWRRESMAETIVAGLAFLTAAALVLLPWLVHVDHVLGRPVLTTNAGFNLYIGNNPAANGWFVSIADTPVGPAWHAMRATLGELGATDRLGALARTYILDHPATVALLGLKKLALFWLPDAPALHRGFAIAALRWVAIAEHLAIVGGALAATVAWRRRSVGERLLILIIALFWAIHAAAYIIPRYHDPVMPLVLVLAAGIVAPRLFGGRPAA